MCWRARRGCGARQPAPHPGDAHGAARATQAGGGAARKAIVYTHIGVHRQLIERALQAKAVPAAVLRGGMNRREQEQAVDVFQARPCRSATGPTGWLPLCHGLQVLLCGVCPRLLRSQIQ